MQALSELAPLLAFVVAYFARGLYTATAVLMVAMALLLLIDWLRLRRIPAMHGASALLIFIFGAATLILHDKRFIQLKPTVLFWLMSLAFLGSFWIGRQTLAERLFGAALGEQLKVSAPQWRVLNGSWVVLNLLLGALNLVVLRYFSERVWIALKPLDVVLIFVFAVAQVLWLNARPAAGGAASAGAQRE